MATKIYGKTPNERFHEALVELRRVRDEEWIPDYQARVSAHRAEVASAKQAKIAKADKLESKIKAEGKSILHTTTHQKQVDSIMDFTGLVFRIEQKGEKKSLCCVRKADNHVVFGFEVKSQTEVNAFTEACKARRVMLESQKDAVVVAELDI